jgi:peroxiredoxin
MLALAVMLVPATIAFAADAPHPLPIGAPAPDFSLPGIDGKTYALADFADAKLLVIAFTCNHCPTAQAYEQRIQAIAKDYRERGVTLIAITPNDPLALRLDELGYTDVGDSFEDTKHRARMRGFDFPYLYDGENQRVSRAYGPVSTPHIFVFDAERKLRYCGRVDDSEKPEKVTSHDARNAIEALLAGKPVSVETTKTFGCSVKWSEKRGTVQESLDKWAKEEVPLEAADLGAIQEILTNNTDTLRLINVWATWCGPCVIEFPELVTMHRMYRGREFELITISADGLDRTDKVHDFLKKQQASMRNLQFSGDNIYPLVEAVDKEWQGALPYTMLVAPGGAVIFRSMGPIVPLELKAAIVDHL